MPVRFDGRKDLIGMLLLPFFPAAVAMITVLLIVPGVWPIVLLLILIVVISIILYKKKKHRAQHKTK